MDHSSTAWTKKVLREYAYQLLSARDYSEKDLKFKLNRRLIKIRQKVEISDDMALGLVADLVEDLKLKKFVDDRRLAENYSRNRLNSKGIKLITLELRRKGIDKDLIEEVIGGSSGSSEQVGTI